MSNFDLVESLLSNLLNASEGDLSDAERAEVQAFIDVGEYGLALETTADIYAEERKIPSTEVLSLIERLAIAMSMEPESVLVRLARYQMNVDKNRLLSQVNAQLAQTCGEKASNLLQDPQVRPVDGAPTNEEVQELLPTLKARLENSQRTGKPIYGLEQVIASLVACNLSDVVIGYGYISPRAAGKFYLHGRDGRFLGATIVDR
ncbi:MafI family immunity protein [Acidovorax sp. LjRoot74]|uniref:MafI family immunity protein n=1 Tax=Acidovorax sp. LjRoot74 TaxID=3342337 RepID=UPI003ED11D7E